MSQFDYTVLLERLHSHPELYPRLITGLARLSEAELAAAQHRSQEALLKARLAREQATAAPKKILTEETLRLIRTGSVSATNTTGPDD